MNENKVNDVINLIIDVSKKFDMVWEIGFSGGKDSTVTLSLLVEAIRQGARIPKLYVVYADTLLEHPLLRKEALDALYSLESERIVPVVLKPEEDFISMMVEKGYPAPHHRFRWCMARLKIRPMQKFLQALGKYVQVSGVRASESTERAKNVKHYANTQKIVNLGNTTLFMPILDWTTEEVFEYLKTHKRWDGRSFDYLLKLYEVKEDAGISCGCSLTTDVRFGCWVCTVVKNDKMPVSSLLKWARQQLIEISNNPTFREFDKEGRPRKLNMKGRKAVAEVFLKVLKEEPEAFGYNVKELEEKLEKIIKE